MGHLLQLVMMVARLFPRLKSGKVGSMSALVHSLAVHSDRKKPLLLVIASCRMDNLFQERNHSACSSGLPGDFHFDNLDSSRNLSTKSGFDHVSLLTRFLSKFANKADDDHK